MRLGALPVYRLALLAAAALLVTHAGAQSRAAHPAAAAASAVRFGILPIGGVVESRENWVPLLTAMGKSINRKVAVLSVPNYEALEQAIRNNEVDMAMLSGKLALNAVAQGPMNVVAEVMRTRESPGHRAVLLTRKAGPLNSLDALLAQPEHWRLARGDNRSLTGFLLPQLRVFLPNRIVMETRFKSELIDNHQNTALAVANGNADVATNNTTDFERFRRNFPTEAEKLHVVWESDATPPVQIVVRRDMAAEQHSRIQAFLTRYGRGAKPAGDAEREVLQALHSAHGYIAADNTSLLPVADLEHQLEKQRAQSAKWVDPAALDARLQRIEQNHAKTIALLRRSSPSVGK